MRMTKIGKASLLAGSFLLSGLVANGQDVEPQAEYPSTERYELGYVQPEREQLCNTLLADYEEYAPGRMDEYYKSGRFVQWTSGMSYDDSPPTYGMVQQPWIDKLEWTYAPIYNDGQANLLIRYTDVEYPYSSSTPPGHILRSSYSQDYRGTEPEFEHIRRALWRDRPGLGINDDLFIREVLTYYNGINATEYQIKSFERWISTLNENEAEAYDTGELKKLCSICDFSIEEQVLDRRKYLYQSGFFLDESEFKRISKLHEQITNKYPDWTKTNKPGEGLNDKDFEFVINILETNITLFKGQLYLYVRYKRPDAAVILHIDGQKEVEEVCYIGRKGSKDRDVEYENINYHKTLYTN